MNRIGIFVFVWLAGLASVHAADRYVRAGAMGSGSGLDWNNAYPRLPAALVRGDTYYIATGVYPAYTFADAPSGAAVITIRKATRTSHGIETGWSDAYGDGEALFTGNGTVWTFKPGVGYYAIEGQVGEANTPGSYGIRLRSTSSRNSATALVAADLSGTYASSGGNQNISFDRVDFDWNNGTSAGASGATRAVQWNTARPNSNIRFSNCFIHHSSGFGIYAQSISAGLLVDGCFFDSNGGSTEYHHETLWVTNSSNFTFRNNTIKDTRNGALTGWLMLGAVSTANIYNNVFTCSSPTACATGGNGIIATWDANQYANSDISIYNNTFANLPTTGNPAIYFYHSGGAVDTNVSVQNNLFFTGAFYVTGALTNAYAACGGGLKCPGVNAQINLQTSIFRGWANQDLRLASGTAPGVPTPFTSDKLGGARAADGNWDRGAFEYSGKAAAPAAPLNLVVQ